MRTAALLLAALPVAQDAPPPADLPDGMHRVVLPHLTEPGLEVELFWTLPDPPKGDGPWPAMLLVHGHQRGNPRPGARFYVDRGFLQGNAEEGLFAAAVSQPGYGASDGPPDYCGPRSQEAVETALAYLRKHPDVRADRIILSGYSRGAMVSAMVATRDTELCGVILGAGTYDLGERYANMGSGRIDSGIKANIEKEARTSEAAFRARSALLAEPTIRVPTLIVHGEDDENCPPEQAIQLADRLNAAGTPVTLKVFPNVGHSIPAEPYGKATEAFLAETVFAEED